MKHSKLSKNGEWTAKCIVKQYASINKACKIVDRCKTRHHTQRVIVHVDRVVCFQFVGGRPLIDEKNWDTSRRYLDRYVSSIVHVNDPQWAENFYCKGDRAEPKSVLAQIPTMLNSNWHGDMCRENIISDGLHLTDIDLREDPYGDVYYDLAKFNRSLLYNSLTDKWIEPSLMNDYFRRWVEFRGFDWEAVQFVTGIVLKRMGKLHERHDFITRGEELCAE